MNDATTAETAPDTKVYTPGAFDFWPASASRIIGLGGGVIDPDPAYAFHTKYVDIGSGVVRCNLRFSGMQASLGSVTIRINGLPPGAGARAESIRTWTATLSEIAEGEGVVELSFQASAGTRYAVLGHIYGEADARAKGLTITLETTPHDGTLHEQLAAARKSIFGRRMFRRADRMISDDAATLADPVSQACTAAQFDEPAYARWCKEIRERPTMHRKQWEFIYILQSLHRYGMLRPGARGIGFGIGTEPLPAVMASHGCSVLATDLAMDDPRARGWSETTQHASSIEALRTPQICANDIFDRQVDFRAVDMNAIDKDLLGFDFTWSSCALEHLGSIDAGLAFIRNSVNCLTYGGLAVHTTEFNLSSNEDTIDNEGTVLFRKRDMERVAVDLISRGHFVAQFKYDLGNTLIDGHIDVPPYSNSGHLKLMLGEFVSTSFGIIVRRGDR